MITLPATVEAPRILVVEDDPIARGILELYLGEEGYDYISVANGREAMEHYGREYFPIVITDWLMPEMDGLELCRAIRGLASERYTYLILLTALDSHDELVVGLEAGADEYIVKPVHQAELRVRIKGARRILDLETSLKLSLTEIRELSIRDSLTSVFNRGYMDQQLVHEVRRSCRYNHSLSVIIADIDHFKKVNDTLGHQAGDEALKHFADIITRSIRSGIDWIARYGGEEFVIILPETDHAGCVVVAERMRLQIVTNPVIYNAHEFTLTASFGAVTIVPAGFRQTASVESIIHAADTCLYQAKNTGRNRVISTQILNETPEN